MRHNSLYSVVPSIRSPVLLNHWKGITGNVEHSVLPVAFFFLPTHVSVSVEPRLKCKVFLSLCFEGSSLSLCVSLPLSLSHTHTHTHSLTHSHARCMVLCVCHKPSFLPTKATNQKIRRMQQRHLFRRCQLTCQS